MPAPSWRASASPIGITRCQRACDPQHAEAGRRGARRACRPEAGTARPAAREVDRRETVPRVAEHPGQAAGEHDRVRSPADLDVDLRAARGSSWRSARRAVAVAAAPSSSSAAPRRRRAAKPIARTPSSRPAERAGGARRGRRVAPARRRRRVRGRRRVARRGVIAVGGEGRVSSASSSTADGAAARSRPALGGSVRRTRPRPAPRGRGRPPTEAVVRVLGQRALDDVVERRRACRGPRAGPRRRLAEVRPQRRLVAARAGTARGPSARRRARSRARRRRRARRSRSPRICSGAT